MAGGVITLSLIACGVHGSTLPVTMSIFTFFVWCFWWDSLIGSNLSAPYVGITAALPTSGLYYIIELTLIKYFCKYKQGVTKINIPSFPWTGID
jgi:hypothetical protein